MLQVNAGEMEQAHSDIKRLSEVLAEDPEENCEHAFLFCEKGQLLQFRSLWHDNMTKALKSSCTPTDNLNKPKPTRLIFFLTASPSCHLHWLDVGVCGSS